jgi:hypothetical protein
MTSHPHLVNVVIVARPRDSNRRQQPQVIFLFQILVTELPEAVSAFTFLPDFRGNVRCQAYFPGNVHSVVIVESNRLVIVRSSSTEH